MRQLILTPKFKRAYRKFVARDTKVKLLKALPVNFSAHSNPFCTSMVG